jgi:nucleoside-diphosphate-sugar epimerase
VNVLVIGGAGYVGSALVPELLNNGYRVCVFDLFLYGQDVIAPHPNLSCIEGDVRDLPTLSSCLDGIDVVIHLACISNDPSFELNPALGKSVNFDCFEPLVLLAKEKGIKKFIYASSSSVYGLKKERNVVENSLLEPLTDYSKYKAMAEEVLMRHIGPSFSAVVVRPATVCGPSPRLRLDLAVNILSAHAFYNNKIKVFGGSQLRPNINIKDMVRVYLLMCELSPQVINGQIYNVGYENSSISDLANMVVSVFGSSVTIERLDSSDLRSYHIDSSKIERELGFKPKHSIVDAIESLRDLFASGVLENPMANPRYYNVKLMLQAEVS